jgi:hypothetical protein
MKTKYEYHGMIIVSVTNTLELRLFLRIKEGDNFCHESVLTVKKAKRKSTEKCTIANSNTENLFLNDKNKNT